MYITDLKDEDIEISVKVRDAFDFDLIMNAINCAEAMIDAIIFIKAPSVYRLCVV